MKMIKRILLGILALLVGLVVLLVISVVVDHAIGAGRLEKITNTSLPGIDGGPQVRAYVPNLKAPDPSQLLS